MVTQSTIQNIKSIKGVRKTNFRKKNKESSLRFESFELRTKANGAQPINFISLLGVSRYGQMWHYVLDIRISIEGTLVQVANPHEILLQMIHYRSRFFSSSSPEKTSYLLPYPKNSSSLVHGGHYLCTVAFSWETPKNKTFWFRVTSIRIPFVCRSLPRNDRTKCTVRP